MKAVVLALVVAACGGPTQQQLAETPTGQSQRNPNLAPPANADDKDRYKTNESFEDQRAAEQARREASGENNAPPPAPLPGQPAPATPGAGSGSATPKKK